MKQSASSLDVKKVNRSRVFGYMKDREQSSMPEIAMQLGLSVPTVLNIVNELKELGIVMEAGVLKSTGGRKAKAVSVVKDFCYTIGLDITRNHIGITYTDLSGSSLEYKRIRKSFRFSEEYLQEIAEIIEQHVKEWGVDEDKIVGMGISLPAIIDENHELIAHSHVLGEDLRNIRIERIISYMPYPCTIVNDANAAAIAETSFRNADTNIVYLSLGNTVGGSIVLQNRIVDGQVTGMQPKTFRKMYRGNHWRSAEFGHIVIHPGGRRCYCGKEGCVDSYCSALHLEEASGKSLEEFFEALRDGDEKSREIWQTYMEDLSLIIDNLRMSFDCDVILGGYVGNYMEPYLIDIQRIVAQRDIFDHSGTYVHVCRNQMESSALGAAMQEIEKYIDTI